MASDESMTVRSCISMQEDEFDDHEDDIEGEDYYQLSRLSVCDATSIDDQQQGTNSNYYELPDDDDDDDDDDVDDDEDHKDTTGTMYHMMSGLSIESFDGDGDVEDEVSDGLKPDPTVKVLERHDHMGFVITSDSDEGCYSLPATPPRMRGRTQRRTSCRGDHGKECLSENEAADDRSRQRRRWRRRRMIMRESLLHDGLFWKKFREEETTMMEMDERVVVGGDHDDEHTNSNNNNNNNHHSKCSSSGGESQSQSESSSMPVVVITRPKGGKRSLTMDLEEVKACRELGFELEMPLPSLPPLLSLNTQADTASTSGSNSPVHWRISSPGDNPRDVKARLKVWAQAVALASTSRQAS